MNSFSTKFQVSDINDFDLDPIYKIGQAHEIDLDKQLDFFNIESREIDSLEPLRKSLKKFFSSQIGSGFIPYFIEITLYDPIDETGQTFYSLLLSSDYDAFLCYEVEMRDNLLASIGGGEDAERGVIIPNPHLYEFSYLSQELVTNFHFPAINFDDCHHKFGSFQERDQGNYRGRQQLQMSVSDFFKEIGEEFEELELNRDGKLLLNQALLIPLYRPAASPVRKDANMIKGGGVFIYGHVASEEFDWPEFTLQLKELFLKAIFRQSFSLIWGTRVRDRSTLIELNTYHHLKSNLQNLVDYLHGLAHTIRSGGPAEKALTSIKKIQSYVSSLTNNSLAILEAYKNYIRNSNTGDRYSVTELEKLKEHLNAYKWSYISGSGEISITSKVEKQLNITTTEFFSSYLAVSAESLHGIISSYIFNVFQAYMSDHESLDGLTVRINISEFRGPVNGDRKRNDHHLVFDIFNNGTHIPENIIKTLGIAPTNSGTSTGLGFYFLNSMLGFVEAFRSENDKRFFELTNMPDGVQLTFKLRLYSNE